MAVFVMRCATVSCEAYDAIGMVYIVYVLELYSSITSIYTGVLHWSSTVILIYTNLIDLMYLMEFYTINFGFFVCKTPF